MLAIIWELWKCGPSKPRVGLPLRFLFCPYWHSGHSGEPPSGFGINVPHGARWPSQGRSAGPAPQPSPNWSPISQGSGAALAGHARRVHTGEFGHRANSRVLSLQISAFGGDDSACCRLQCSEVYSAHWAGYIVIKEGNAAQKSFKRNYPYYWVCQRKAGEVGGSEIRETWNVHLNPLGLILFKGL